MCKQKKPDGLALAAGTGLGLTAGDVLISLAGTLNSAI
jgi:hypothetical protein